MNNLFPDIYYLLAQKLDTKSLIKFASTNKRIYNIIMNNKSIWLYLLIKEYNYIPKNYTISYIDIYKEFFMCRKRMVCNNDTFMYIMGNSIISNGTKWLEFDSSDPPINISLGRRIILIQSQKRVLHVYKLYKPVEYIQDCVDMCINNLDTFFALKKNNNILIYHNKKCITTDINNILVNDEAIKIAMPHTTDKIYILCKSGCILVLEVYIFYCMLSSKFKHIPKIYEKYFFYKPKLETEKFIKICSYTSFCIGITNKGNLYKIVDHSLIKDSQGIINITTCMFNNSISIIREDNTIIYRYRVYKWIPYKQPNILLGKYVDCCMEELELPKMENDMIIDSIIYGKFLIGMSLYGKILTLKELEELLPGPLGL